MSSMVMRRACSLAAAQPLPRQINLVRQASSGAGGSKATSKGLMAVHAALAKTNSAAPAKAAAAAAAPAAKAAAAPAQSPAAPAGNDVSPPEGHKRRMTGWMVFCKERRAQLVAGKAEIHIPTLMKQLGQEWKALPEKTRAQYNTKADALPPMLMKARADKGKKRTVSKPFAPNGFMMYSKEHRPRVAATMPGAKASEVAKKLGEEWRKLSEAQKQSYKALGIKQFQETMAKQN